MPVPGCDTLSRARSALASLPAIPSHASPCVHTTRARAQAADLVSKLLQKDITRRYGNLREGAKDIKDHKFYAAHNFDWSNYAQRGAAFNPPKFDPSKYEWLPAESIVTDAKPCSAKDSALFADF